MSAFIAWCNAIPTHAAKRAAVRTRTASTCTLDDASRARVPAQCRRALVSISASILISVLSINATQAEIISKPLCYKGDGPGCEATAQDSELVRDLLEKSKRNREKNDKQVLEKYWRQGYGDYFSFGFNKELVKDEDGKWSLVDPKGFSTEVKRRLEALIKSTK
ncbi:unnamed protein product [Agarophyton chilense]